MAVAFKKKGQKDKALRLLREIKTIEKQIAQAGRNNLLFLKQMGTLEAVTIDNTMADELKKTVG